jgi:hypothetical protein
MKQIKTIMQPIDTIGDASAFDNEVNAALTDGWQLHSRMTLKNPAVVFVAYLEKDTEQEQEVSRESDRGVPAEVGYKGFLYIRCEKCGIERGYSAKKSTRAHFCTCGHRTPLVDLARVDAKCECGNYWMYHTNIQDRIFSMDCLYCGSPIDLERHPRDNIYKSMLLRDGDEND